MESQLKTTSKEHEMNQPSDPPGNFLPEWTLTPEAWQRRLDQKEKQIQALNSELSLVKAQLRQEKVERERWAQFLHDAINQSLFSAGLIAEVLPRLWERDQAAARTALDDLHRLTFGAIAEMRILLAESRPSLLQESELGDLLLLLGNMVAGRLNIPVAVKIDQKIKLVPEVQTSVFHLCKELLNQISRRSKASQIELGLVRSDPYMDIRIGVEDEANTAASLVTNANEDLISVLIQARANGVELQPLRPLEKGMEISIHWKMPVEK